MIYTDLREDIRLWTSNTDAEFLASINRFIRQGENLITTSVRLPNFTNTVVVNLNSSVGSLTVPADFISVDFISFPFFGILEEKSTGFLQEAYPDPSETGPVRYFARRDDQTIVFAPVPDLPVSGTMQYFSRPTSIVDVALGSSTYIASNFEVALLHGSLMFAAVFMKDPEMKAIHQELFMQSLGLTEKFAKGRAKKQDAEKTNAANESGDLT